MATSPLPSRGSPALHSGGQNQKWPTCGQGGYVTPAILGIPTASERGAKSEVAHLWARWLRHPCRLGDPHRCRAGGGNQKWPTCGQSGYVTPAVSGIPTASERGGKSEVAHLWARWLRHPCRLEVPHRCRAGGKIRSGPLVGKVATSPLPSRGSPPLQSGGGKSEVAHLWARWLLHPCRLGDPHRCRAGGEIRNGPLVGKVAMSPLPSRGSPPLQSGGQNQKWPTCGQGGYITPAVSGIPTAAERGAKSEVAHFWARWLRHPCHLGDPHRFRAGGKIRSGPLVGKVATSPLPSRGSPALHSGGQNQKWPPCGQSGYVTPTVSGIPTASERGQNNKWPTCGQGGYVTPAVSGIPTAAERGGQNQKWPTCGQGGYVTPAITGIPTAAERGAKSEVAHLWAKWLCHPCHLGHPHRCRAGGVKSEVAHLWARWLRHPCRLGDPHRFTAGGKIRSGPLVGKVATPPLPSRGSPPL